MGSTAATALMAGTASLLPKLAFASDEFSGMDAVTQAGLVKKGKVSSLKLVEAAIKRIEAVNGKTNGSRLFDKNISAETSAVPQKALDAGMVVLGKTNRRSSVCWRRRSRWSLDRATIPGLSIIRRADRRAARRRLDPYSGLKLRCLRAEAQPGTHRYRRAVAMRMKA